MEVINFFHVAEDDFMLSHNTLWDIVVWLHCFIQVCLKKNKIINLTSLTTVICFLMRCSFLSNNILHVSLKKKTVNEESCLFSHTVMQTSKSLTYVLSVCKSSAITNLNKKIIIVSMFCFIHKTPSV